MTATTRLQELIGEDYAGDYVGTANLAATYRNSEHEQQRKAIPTATRKMLEDIKVFLPKKKPSIEGGTIANKALSPITGYNLALDEVTAVLEQYFGEGE